MGEYLFIVILIGSYIAYCFFRSRREWYIREHGIAVTGHIEGIDDYEGYHLIVSYEVQGEGFWRTAICSVPYRYPCAVGDLVRVLYHPQKPHHILLMLD